MEKSRSHNFIRLEQVSSTNDYARDLLRDNNPEESTIILAAYQSEGKGHDGNSWESEAGKNLLMTIILYPEFLEVSRQFYLSMAVSLGITDGLSELFPGESFCLKWPNDIYYGDRKLGGILINNEIIGDSFRYVLAGIGINVNQEEFSSNIPNPVSLAEISGSSLRIDQIAEIIASSIMKRMKQLQSSLEVIKDDYHTKMLGMGKPREFIYKGQKIKASIKDIDEFGHLILETAEKSITCDLKEVEFVF